jgi:ATP-dependent RNA helicase RhlB
MKLLLGILEQEKPESAIIFCNTKRYTEIVAKRLRLNDYKCEFIIGDLPQSKRLKIISDIKDGKISFLVATDVAARGLDIEALALVVNYDLPVEPENYVHRIGRTARAGKSGKAIALASEHDVYELPAIEKYIGAKITSAIATEELFANDKSEGVHIQTDVYETESYNRDRDQRDRDQYKRERRSQYGDRQHEDHNARETHHKNRQEKHEHNRDSKEARDRKAPLKKEGQGKEGQKRSQNDSYGSNKNRKHRFEDKKDLSALSFDERMAYYKQKYASKSYAARDKAKSEEQNENSILSKENPKVVESVKNTEKKKERATIESPVSPVAVSAPVSAQKEEKVQAKETESPINPPPDVKSVEKKANKGILSKIFGGLFNKKEEK